MPDSFVKRTAFNVYLNAAAGLLGVQPGHLISSPRLGKWLSYLALASDALIALFFVSNSVCLLSPGTPIAERCINFLTNSTFMTAMAKLSYFLLRRNKFQRFCDTWDASFANTPHAWHADLLHATEQRRVRVMTVCLLVMFTLTAVPWCFLPAFTVLQEIHGGRYLNVPIWVPGVDLLRSPFNEIAMALTSIAAWFTVAKTIAFDGCFFAYVSLEIAQLDHLKFTIGKIFDEQEENEAAVQGMADKASTQLEAYSGSKLTMKHRQHGFAQKRRTGLEARLALWVQHHQQAMVLGEMLYELYSPTIIAQFVTTTLILCFTSFTITSVHLDAVQYVLTPVYCIGCTLQLYLLCHYGDRLKEASVSISEACFASGWHKSHVKRVRSSLLLILQRIQKPLTFSFYGVYPLSAEMFVNIMQGSVSYLMILLNITEETSQNEKQL